MCKPTQGSSSHERRSTNMQQHKFFKSIHDVLNLVPGRALEEETEDDRMLLHLQNCVQVVRLRLDRRNVQPSLA